jgi:hypothetical protein
LKGHFSAKKLIFSRIFHLEKNDLLKYLARKNVGNFGNFEMPSPQGKSLSEFKQPIGEGSFLATEGGRSTGVRRAL